MVERAAFPRYKVCGCCLNPRSLGILEAAGLTSLLKAADAEPLDHVTIGAGGRAATLRLPGGMALSRDVFDSKLAEAAVAAGAHFLPQTTAKLDPVSGSDHRVVHLRTGPSDYAVEATFVVDATGLGGKLVPDVVDQLSPNSRIGAGVMTTHAGGYDTGTIYMACGTAGYVGLVRVEGHQLDIAAAFDPAAVKQAGGLGPLAVRILADAGFPPVPGLEDLPWKGTPQLTRRREALAENRLFRVGDAVGYVEPFTGEGMAWALAAAVAVVPIISRGLAGDQADLAWEWTTAYHRPVARRQAVCKWTAWTLRRPRLTTALVRVLARLPVLAGPVLRGMYRR